MLTYVTQATMLLLVQLVIAKNNNKINILLLQTTLNNQYYYLMLHLALEMELLLLLFSKVYLEQQDVLQIPFFLFSRILDNLS